MKKMIARVIVIVAAIVLVLGVMACISTYVANNPKAYAVSAKSGYNFAKDGRQIVSYVVSKDETDRYVQSTKSETINQVEYYRRLAKNRKILIKIAETTYEADMSESNLTDLNTAKANYNVIRAQLHAINSANFTRTCTTFFGTFMPIIVLLSILFVINLKADYSSLFELKK